MSEKVLAVVRPSAFTSHYTVKRTDGLLECRTVHRCPKCGKAHLIIWGNEKSMYWTDIIFGFRKAGAVLHVQSFCRSCRCHPRPTVAKSLVNTVVCFTLSNGDANNG